LAEWRKLLECIGTTTAEQASSWLRHAHRLLGDLRHAELVTLPDTGAFVPEDAPDRLAELIITFYTRYPFVIDARM
jgi:pimeloyl-ACP methyl ester carboxylesterase